MFKKKPDICYDFGTSILICEVDEDSHKSNDTNCETVRMLKLYQDLPERPILFLRINPDKCKIRKNSMFLRTKKNQTLKCFQEEFDYRMNEFIAKCKAFYNKVVIENGLPEKSFDVQYLFY